MVHLDNAILARYDRMMNEVWVRSIRPLYLTIPSRAQRRLFRLTYQALQPRVLAPPTPYNPYDYVYPSYPADPSPYPSYPADPFYPTDPSDPSYPSDPSNPSNSWICTLLWPLTLAMGIAIRDLKLTTRHQLRAGFRRAGPLSLSTIFEIDHLINGPKGLTVGSQQPADQCGWIDPREDLYKAFTTGRAPAHLNRAGAVLHFKKCLGQIALLLEGGY